MTDDQKLATAMFCAALENTIGMINHSTGWTKNAPAEVKRAIGARVGDTLRELRKRCTELLVVLGEEPPAS
ncbi:MAG TPA: hypothetical protein VFB62_01695 [Polyangiaceae bacterium]|nr:hypothetical protein [Polyangiaceae bacterium]